MINLKKKYKSYRKNNIYIIIGSIFILLVFCIFYNYKIIFKTTIFTDIGSSINRLFIPKKIDYQNITSLQERRLKDDINDLKKLLDLKQTATGYKMIFSTITSRNVDYWFYTVTIDKGRKDGISKDMIVINENGLVGRILEVHNHSSIVKLISANDSYNKIAVDIISEEDTYKGVISGYDTDTNSILVTCIRSTSKVKVGDTIETNGIGTLFPNGIIVGTVEKIISDDLGISKVLKVKSNVNFENIRYVAVLKKDTNE